MNVETSSAWIARTSSIENEPRTLSFREMECAREAALFVMNTRSTEDALSVFTEGLKPVVSSVGICSRSVPDSQFCCDNIKYKLLLADLRDIATAPF
ncbi:hypothetical protein SAY87_016531 [Trapa incisa]|uniref:Uncharacterized protein n=1 Tax=Trapa incisa TaxID=236973 RepID=A0AAN7QY52_9MYRT|nr:hypothetical protein SAY87_016531 [Trapa incisa]